MSEFGEYDKYDGLGLAELVRKKEVKPSQLVEEAIRWIEVLNPHLNAVINKMYDQVFGFIPFTPLFNATGQPATSVPLYWNDEGLPIGMHFVGRYGDEATLFRLAGQLEKVHPWSDRIPPILRDNKIA